MEGLSITSNGIFSLHVLIILGITVALVSAVAVILYNKIQQQGEKLSAVMELSTVLAQELRSHDTALKQMQASYTSSKSTSFGGSSSPHNIVFVKPDTDHDIEKIYVSDGSGSSDDEYSTNAINAIDDIQHLQPSTLDNILMNPMCFGSNSNAIEEVTFSEDENLDDESNTEENSDDDLSELQSILSTQIEELTQQDDDNLENSSSEKRTVTLSEISAIEPTDEEEGDEEQSDIHRVAMDVENNIIDYKKSTVNELRRIAIERNLIDKGCKMKKTELIQLLGNNV